MTKLPRISGQETIKALKKLGFEVARQRGLHVGLKKDTSSEKIGYVVPLHSE